jgi:ATP/maltotriose-dependent transcriptional regulator MalT
MTKNAPKNAQVIPPDAYPQMMSKQNAARAMKTLRSAQTAVKAQVAMEAAVPPMRAAILQYVDELEKAGGDMELVFEKVHEIRGFAETAGLITTGRIAEILGRYMDDMRRIGRPMDAAIVALHVSAVARAARAEEDDVRMGEVVAAELAGLVARRLADAER